MRLGLSQPYLSLIEKGERPVTENLAHRAAKLYALSQSAIPIRATWQNLGGSDQQQLASDLASLGYPPLSYLKQRRRRKNPAEVLLSALNASNLDSRLVEALPWVVLKFPDMDWGWLKSAAKLNDLQNRLGFVISVALRLAEKLGESEKAALLGRQEAELLFSRLAREDTLCHDSLTRAEKQWLRKHRSKEAKRWNLLTDLSPEHLEYAA
jgi:transcriptional regulator with XRE-family HTH domain